MSQTVVRRTFEINGVLTTATTALLSSADSTFGVKRNDNDAVVVADGTALVEGPTGIYSYTFDDPADGLVYTWAAEFTYGTPTETYRFTTICNGGSDANVNLYNLIPQVHTKMSGGTLPDEIIQQALRLSAVEFCRDTDIWQEDLASIASVADQKTYTPVVSFDAIIARILRIRYDDTDDLDSANVSWKYFSPDGQSLKLISASAETGKDIDVRVVLVPKETCTNFPPWLLNRWEYAIVARTIWHLKTHPSYRDRRGAEAAHSEYMDARTQARHEVHSKRAPMPIKARKKRFI